MIYNYVGYVGAILYLFGFFLLSIRRITSHSFAFQLCNLVGAIGVSIAALYNHDTPSIVLNVVWGAIALASITFALSRQRT